MVFYQLVFKKFVYRLKRWLSRLDTETICLAGNFTTCGQELRSRCGKRLSQSVAFKACNRVYTDYCECLLGKYYALVVVDTSSRYLEQLLTTVPMAEFTELFWENSSLEKGVTHALAIDIMAK